jgi:hypothetical protein
MIIKRIPKPIEADVSTRPELVVPWWEIMFMAIPMLGFGIVLSAYFDLTHPTGSFYLLISDRFFLLNGAFQSAMLAAFLSSCAGAVGGRRTCASASVSSPPCAGWSCSSSPTAASSPWRNSPAS